MKQTKKVKRPPSDLQRAVLKAKKYLEAGDPTEAVAAMELALYLHMSGDDRRTLYNAMEEADIGSVEKAETLLGCITFNKPTNEDKAFTPARPPKHKPFKFKPKKDAESVGRNNGERAADADEMLSLVLDADSMAPREVLCDALTNLLHWCDREQVSFDDALRMAKGHHEAER